MTVLELILTLLVLFGNGIVFYTSFKEKMYLFGIGLLLFLDGFLYMVTHEDKVKQFLNIKLF